MHLHGSIVYKSRVGTPPAQHKPRPTSIYKQVPTHIYSTSWQNECDHEWRLGSGLCCRGRPCLLDLPRRPHELQAPSNTLQVHLAPSASRMSREMAATLRWQEVRPIRNPKRLGFQRAVPSGTNDRNTFWLTRPGHLLLTALICSEEHKCRFCDSELPDWRPSILGDNEEQGNAPKPLMAKLVFNNQIHVIPILPVSHANSCPTCTSFVEFVANGSLQIVAAAWCQTNPNVPEA